MKKIGLLPILVILLLHVGLSTAGVLSMPEWAVNPSEYSKQVSVIGVLSLNEEKTGAGNKVGAFVGATCRGSVQPVQISGDWLYFLTVYSNTENETIHFKAYIADEDVILDVDETLVFVTGKVYGSSEEPFQWHAFLHYDFPPEVGDIPDQTIETGGSFTQFDLDDSLNLRDGDAIAWTYSGNSALDVSMDADNVVCITPINPEWIGSETITFTATDQTANQKSDGDDAMFTITGVDHAPEVSGIEDQYVAPWGIFEPFDLDEYLTETDGHATAWSHSFSTEDCGGSAPGWSVTPSEFKGSMTVVAEVFVRGRWANTSEYKLGAFIGGECRGTATLVDVSGENVFWMAVHGDVGDSEVSFQLYDAVAREVVGVYETVPYVQDHQYGVPSDPEVLHAGHVVMIVDEGHIVTPIVVDSSWAGSKTVFFKAQDQGTLHEYSDSDPVQFYRMTSTQASGDIGLGVTQDFTFEGNDAAQVRWGTGGTVPSNLEVSVAPNTIYFNLPCGVVETVSLYWSFHPAGGADWSATVRLYYEDSELDEPPIPEDTLKIWKTHDSGLTWEEVHVTARDVAENWVEGTVSSFSDFVVGNGDASLPAPPTSPAATAGNNQVELRWDANTEADLHAYYLYRDTSSPASTLLDSVVAQSSPDTSYVDTNVVAGTTYYYRATALNSAGNESGFSEEVSATSWAYGDVSGNGRVMAFDAALILQYTVGLIDSTDWPFLTVTVGDVSGDTTISAYDASLTLQYVVGKISKFPVEDGAPLSKPVFSSSLVNLAAAECLEDGSLLVPIMIDQMRGVLSGQIELSFDRRAFRAIRVAKSDRAEEFLFAAGIYDGQVRLSFAGVESRQGGGKIAVIRFERIGGVISDGVTDIRLTKVQFNEAPSTVSIQSARRTSEIPASFRLSQNFPNPFNPVTTIRYQLPRASEVRLAVYDVLGRKVQVLVEGLEEAGCRSVVWNAKEAASGIYFVRMKAGDFVEVRKMVVVR